MEELNKKLAEWAGWTINKQTRYWQDPDGFRHGSEEPPNFTHSPDVCFKWLVPKAQDEGIVIHLICYEHKGFGANCYDIVHNVRYDDVENDNSTLAICLAIEKFIDEQSA